MKQLASLAKTSTVLFLGNNDESTDRLVSLLALKNKTINHGLIVDREFIPENAGYFHTTVVDIPFGHLLSLAQRFDTVVMLDQPRSQWSHWKCMTTTLKVMIHLEKSNKHTIFRDNLNLRKFKFWSDLVYNQNKSFCIYPWINLNSTEEELKLCARDSSTVTKLENLIDWKSNTEYVKIRQAMLNGQRLPEHCSFCYNYEDLGIESYRQFETLDWVAQLDLNSIEDLANIDRPYYYEITLGNHCNIKCRSCQPKYSKPIGDEIKKFNIITPKKFSWKPLKSSVDQINIDTLDQKTTVYFQGGEPSIMPEVSEFLEKCLQQGKTNFNLSMCTNGVKFSSRFLELVSQFSNVNFSFSIDGYGHINDYWRSGSQWDKVISNLRLIQSQGHYVSINTVPGIYNVTNLHLLFEFLDRELPFTAVYIQINYLHWQSAFNHPNAELVIESMKRCQQTSIYHSNGKSCKSSIDSLMQHYSNNPVCNLDDLRTFFDYNDQLDRVRGVKLADYIPELEAARSLL
jgi:sulfatase maturation enzyme AslB (radical SAM superfamily)